MYVNVLSFCDTESRDRLFFDFSRQTRTQLSTDKRTPQTLTNL